MTKKPGFPNPPAKGGKTIPIHRDLSGGSNSVPLYVLNRLALLEYGEYPFELPWPDVQVWELQ